MPPEATRRVGGGHRHRRDVDRAERERGVVCRRMAGIRWFGFPSCHWSRRFAVRPGHAQRHGGVDDVAQPDLLLKLGVEGVDRVGRPGVQRVRCPCRLGRWSSNDPVYGLERVCPRSCSSRDDRLGVLDRRLVAEGHALLERREQGEQLGRRSGLHAVLAAVLRVDRVVDLGLALVGVGPVLPVLGDREDLPGAGLDQRGGVDVVVRVVVVVAVRDDVVDRVGRGRLVLRGERGVDLQPAGRQQLGAVLGRRAELGSLSTAWIT